MRVLQAAVFPEPVDAGIDLERSVRAQLPVEGLAAIPDQLEDFLDPLLVDSECLAYAGRDAEQALDRRIEFHHLADVLGGDAVLLSSIIAYCTKQTMLAFWLSQWRITAPSGSPEMIFGRIT